MKLPPGPRHFKEIINIISQRMKDPLTLYNQIFEKYGPIVYFKVGANKFAMISEAKAAEQILHTDGKHFTKSILYERFKLILGNGLLVSDGELWKKQRRLMAWAFSSKHIEKVHPLMVKEIKEMLKSYQGKSEINLADEMNAVTLQVISASLFGMSNLEEASKVRRAVKDMLKYLQTTRFLTIMFFLSPLPMKEKHKLAIKIESMLPMKDTRRFFEAIEEINQLVIRMIEERKKLNRNENLLDAMIHATDSEDQSQMTSTQLKDEAVTMFIAGHETTATALTWTWLMLLKNPETMAKVRQEVEEHFKDEDPSYHTVQKLEYTKAVLEESMRLYPPFWRISRKTAGELKLHDYTIPEGTNIVTSIFNLHRSPLYWESPMEFRPERFLNGQKPKEKFSYIPFGAGMRVCIGAQFAIVEALTILCLYVKHFEFEKNFSQDPQIFASLTIHPKEGCPVKLKPVREILA
jgi:cytochrome P450